jgi:hypothetical protein
MSREEHLGSHYFPSSIWDFCFICLFFLSPFLSPGVLFPKKEPDGSEDEDEDEDEDESSEEDSEDEEPPPKRRCGCVKNPCCGRTVKFES